MRGQERIVEGQNLGNFMSQVVETVSRCSDEGDDNVQLQVIKVLLVVVTSEYCNVHEGGLLLAIRACFHVNLITRNQANKTTAKAALTQILSVVNQRMEVHDERIKTQSKDAPQTTNVDGECNTPMLEAEDASSSSVDGGNSSNKSVVISDIDSKESGDNEMENVNSFASDDASGTADGESVSSAAEKISESNGFDGFDIGSSGDDIFPSIYHKDAFLLYRALCKLSMKSIQDDKGDLNDPIVLQNKILSLELILHILVYCGPAFRAGEKIIHVSKSYLCVSILGNCTSQVPLVTSLSLQVFVALMENFRDHLKSELEVFVTNIFLRILESENSPYEHKLRVLDVFHNIIDDPTGLLEIFINFDCDFEAIDLFRRIVDAFSKIAKVRHRYRDTMELPLTAFYYIGHERE